MDPSCRFVGFLLRCAEFLPLLSGLFGHQRDAVGAKFLHDALAVVVQPTWGLMGCVLKIEKPVEKIQDYMFNFEKVIYR